ncbi:MAG: selenocysteine-specific translation elongation factor [Aquificae bacterium]|nr:selenocysteine-specific translation elongation factor [Aquificota bacterium]
MRFVLFAVGGHVDHGKTTLIKALTGIDTDRLPEEKRRGLSIDLGFAYLDYPEDNLRVELIDIPGHERFIKNAVAGLAGAEGLLLVVDAGEGVMPQTVEHLKVAKAFGMERGVAVLTKIDKVDSGLLSLAREEVVNLLREEGLNFPVVEVSSKNGEGLEDLRSAIKNVSIELLSGKEELPLRVLIDSAFKVKGHGTVVRGSCVEGKVQEGDKIILEPLGVKSRVRKIQNHGVFVRTAQAGERVALNLPDVDADKVERGFWVLKPETYEKSAKLLVHSEEEFKNGKLYYLFFGMREVRGRFSKVSEGLYLLRLEEEVVSRRKDRFAVLSSEGRFAGGGEVLHPKVRILKKGFIRENARELLESFELYLLRESGTEGFSGEYFRKLTGKAPDTKVLEEKGIKIGSRFYDRELLERLKVKLEDFLNKASDEVGVPKAEVVSRFGLREEVLEYVLGSVGGFILVGDFIVREGREGLDKNPYMEKLIELTEKEIMEEKKLISEGIPKEIIRVAVKSRKIHRLGDYLLISDTLLKGYVEELKRLGESFTLQSAKEKLGLTRKYLIPLLEYLDYLGLTEREGNERRWKSFKI